MNSKKQISIAIKILLISIITSYSFKSFAYYKEPDIFNNDTKANILKTLNKIQKIQKQKDNENDIHTNNFNKFYLNQEKNSSLYLKPFEKNNRNYLLLFKGYLYSKMCFSSESPIIEELANKKKELYKKLLAWKKRVQRNYYRKKYRLRKKFLKKKKYSKWKKVRIRKRIRKKKIVYWMVPKKSKIYYNKRLAQALFRLNREIGRANNWYSNQLLVAIEKANHKRYNYFKKAEIIFISISKANENILKGLGLSFLSLLYTQVNKKAIEINENYDDKFLSPWLYESLALNPFKPENKVIFHNKAFRILRYLFKKRNRYFPNDKYVLHYLYLKNILKDDIWVKPLLRSGQVQFIYLLYDLHYLHGKKTGNYDYLYKKLHLSIDQENYYLANNVISKILGLIKKSEVDQEEKDWQYIKIYGHRANLFFIESKYKESYKLNKRLNNYALKSIKSYGLDFKEKLKSKLDFIAGTNYRPSHFAAKYFIGRYYNIMQRAYNPFENSLSTLNSNLNEDHVDELKELAGEIKSYISKTFSSLNKSSYSKNKERIRIILSVVLLEYDPNKSEKISDDITYITQAENWPILEYYSTLIHGFGQIKMNRFRRARTDYTKSSTILLGLNSFPDMTWVNGIGKTMIEVKEYSYLFKNVHNRHINRGRNKSLRFLKSHLKKTVYSLKWANLQENLHRLRACLPYGVTPKKHLTMLKNIAAVYKLPKWKKSLIKQEQDLFNFNNSFAYLRYLERQIKKDQFELLQFSTSKIRKNMLKERLAQNRREIWNKY